MNLIMRICLPSLVIILQGCVANPYGGGIALGVPSLLHIPKSKEIEEKDKKAVPPVYGPPQVIYRIDNERYFTLEEYTRCENGKTFYNNKAKGIHTKISSSSGYLFKGRLFWLSTRDDYLAFPMTRNENKAACMGSDKGCVKIISVTTDGGETFRSIPYGSYTQDPNGDTKNYDMLVMNDGFYLIYYRGSNRGYPVIDRWVFNPKNASRVDVVGNEYELFRPGEKVPVGGFYNISLSSFYSKYGVQEMQCDRNLEPASIREVK